MIGNHCTDLQHSPEVQSVSGALEDRFDSRRNEKFSLGARLFWARASGVSLVAWTLANQRSGITKSWYLPGAGKSCAGAPCSPNAIPGSHDRKEVVFVATQLPPWGTRAGVGRSQPTAVDSKRSLVPPHGFGRCCPKADRQEGDRDGLGWKASIEENQPFSVFGKL